LTDIREGERQGAASGEEYGGLMVPPHSIDAEQSVLGALLLDNQAFERVGDILAASDFYASDHRAIFETICTLIVANKPADVITVFDRGAGSHDLAYLHGLTSGALSSAHVRRYAEIVRERSIARQLIVAGWDMVSEARDVATSAEEKLVSAQERLEAIASAGRAGSQEPVLMDATMPAYIDTIEARASGNGGDVYPTGMHDLDKMMTGGLRPKRAYFIGARPSMGKTTIALTIARHIAQQPGLAALVLSMEMPAEQINDGCIAALGNIPLDKVLQPNVPHPDISDDEFWTRLTEAIERVRSLNLYVDDEPALRLLDVRRKIVQAKRRARQAGVRLVLAVLDYIQIMRGSGDGSADKEAATIAANAEGLAEIAKREGVAIIVLSQVKREADGKPEGADSMSDLLGSGGIEAAASFVALLHREYVRQPDTKELEHYAELRVPKNRIGKVGRVKLFFDGAHQFFGSWEGQSPIVKGKVRGTLAGGLT